MSFTQAWVLWFLSLYERQASARYVKEFAGRLSQMDTRDRLSACCSDGRQASQLQRLHYNSRRRLTISTSMTDQPETDSLPLMADLERIAKAVLIAEHNPPALATEKDEVE